MLYITLFSPEAEDDGGLMGVFLSAVGLLEDTRPAAFSTTGLTLTQTH